MATSLLLSQYWISQKHTAGFSGTALTYLSGGHYDLISFLALMQFLGLDLITTRWKSALEDLGMGGSAIISQASINTETSFAFKRLSFDVLNTEKCFERLMKEAMVLMQIPVTHNENFIRLEAYCLDVQQEPERITPVLIFEKFPLGNLQDYLLSERGRNTIFRERLAFCADIAYALSTLHEIHIVHGDVKPLNALVFEQNGKRVVKVADLGDAAICHDEETLAFLPVSRPWNAPEYHHRGFSFLSAVKMDIYSFGLVCLWTLFGDGLSLLAVGLDQHRDRNYEMSGLPSSVATLAMLKRVSNIQEVALKVVHALKEVSQERKSGLATLFHLTLAEVPTARISDMQLILKLLGDDRILENKYGQLLVDHFWVAYHHTFRLVEYMILLSHEDYRIRFGIIRYLKHQYNVSGCSKCRDDIALQLAISYRTGFGQPRSLEVSFEWLAKSGKSTNVIDSQLKLAEIWILPPAINKRIHRLRHEFFKADYIHESRMVPRTGLSQLKADLAQEVQDIEVSFGETHPMTICLKRKLAQILTSYGLYGEAAEIQESLIESLKAKRDRDNEVKVLGDLCHTYSIQDRLNLAERYRSEIVDYLTRNLGEGHMGTLSSLTNLAHTQNELGLWKEAEKNLLRVIAVKARVAGDEHDETLKAKSVLAGVYSKQGQMMKARDLQSLILEARLRTLGEQHKSTWYSMSNLASIWYGQGRFKEAEETESKVLALRLKFLGPDHLDTLTSMYNLALTYGKNKRTEEEESMIRQVLDTRKSILGDEHGDTLQTMSRLAKIYQDQEKFHEAERLEAHVFRARSEKLGRSHPLVLASGTNLMWMLYDQGYWEQAKTMQLESIEGAKHEGGESESVLKCMSALASMYKLRRCLTESLTLYEQVLRSRIVLLGNDHRDTSKTVRDIEIVKRLLEM